MTPSPGLYAGRVTHRRLRPRRHVLAYRVFNLLLDLDAVDEPRLRLLSRNRFNLLSFHDRDHGDRSETPLRAQIERMAGEAGVHDAIHRIMLLCMPRVLGYVFNPLSVYFCYARDGRLTCLVYEVSNTFGQRHSYVIPVQPGQAGEAGPVRQSCSKGFYVSPFLDMDLVYDFEIRPPGAKIGVAVVARDASGPVIATAFSATRRPLSDAGILRAVLTHPFLTLKVVAGIHWEALALWRKGIGLRPRPPAPAEPFTAVPALDLD